LALHFSREGPFQFQCIITYYFKLSISAFGMLSFILLTQSATTLTTWLNLCAGLRYGEHLVALFILPFIIGCAPLSYRSMQRDESNKYTQTCSEQLCGSTWRPSDLLINLYSDMFSPA
jgi:hypothetical protein